LQDLATPPLALSAALLQRLRDLTSGGFLLGGPRFERQIAALLGRRTWKGSPGRPAKNEGDGGRKGSLPSKTWSVSEISQKYIQLK